MANRDRLTALDAAFLHLERSGAHMHVAGGARLRGRGARLRRARRARSRRAAPRAALPPAARLRAARPGPPGVGRRPALQRRATTCATARCPRRAPTSSSRNLAGRLFAQPLDRTKPLWELWLVEGLDGDRFAIISKTHHALVDGVSGVDITSVLFDTSPDPAPAGAPRRAVGAAPAARPTPSCWPRRCSSARRCPPRSPAALRALTRAPRQALGAGRRVARRRRRDGVGGAQPGAAVARSTCRSARTGATRGSTPTSRASRRSRTPSAARSTTSCSPRWRSRSGASCAAAAIDTDGLVLKAMVPVSVRADDAARRAGQPRRGDVGAAAGRRRRTPRRCFARGRTRRCAASRSPGRPSARRR